MLLAAGSAFAQESLRQEIERNPYVAAGNNALYPAPAGPVKPKAPKGFKPFYISHYARHGSRWLISESDYGYSAGVLHEQYDKGNLTALGEDVMRRMDKVCDAVKGHYEELTPEGALQHRGIAQRMYATYPKLLGGRAKVRARSTTVIRCILSMNAFTSALQGCNPTMEIQADASRGDMWYMHWGDPDHIIPVPDVKSERDSIQKHIIKDDPGRFMSSIFKHPEGISPKIYGAMYHICGNMPGTPLDVSFWDLYTTDELYAQLYPRNVGWYFARGYAPQNKYMRPFVQTNLLRTIIAQADEAVAGGEYSADLRFGHDSIIASLLSLMNLNELGESYTDYDRISEIWRIDKIIPMATNLQMSFYRNRNGEVLVHFALNETPASLPLAPYCDGFYRWEDVRAYWETRLEASPVK